MVCNDRPVYQEEHAAQLIMAKRDRSPLEGRIHLRRPLDKPFAFSLQSRGGPYISDKWRRLLLRPLARLKLWRSAVSVMLGLRRSCRGHRLNYCFLMEIGRPRSTCLMPQR